VTPSTVVDLSDGAGGRAGLLAGAGGPFGAGGASCMAMAATAQVKANALINPPTFWYYSRKLTVQL
jgi:hypothetical protein